MTLQQLASQLGITPKEVVALCVVAGVKVTGPDQVLTDAEVGSIQRVLSGEQSLKDPTKKKGPKKLGVTDGNEFTRRPVWPWVVGIVVLGFILLGAIVGSRLSGEPRITVLAGECFNADLFGGSVWGTEISRAPCSEATYRAYAVLDLEEVWTEFPGQDEVEKRARQRCPTIASGIDVEDGAIYYFGPGDERAWESPYARKIVCAVRT